MRRGVCVAVLVSLGLLAPACGEDQPPRASEAAFVRHLEAIGFQLGPEPLRCLYPKLSDATVAELMAVEKWRTDDPKTRVLSQRVSPILARCLGALATTSSPPTTAA